MSFEEKMKKELKKNLEIPDVVEQKIQDAYREIGQGNVTMKKLNNGNQKKRKSMDSGSCSGSSNRSIRKRILCKPSTGEEYSSDRRCLFKTAEK